MSSFMSAVTEQSSTFKVVVVGQRAVGKTSLAVRYVQGKFSSVYAVTIGIEFYSKVITHEQEQYNLQIWDTVPLALR